MITSCKKKICGWGHYPQTESYLLRPECPQDLILSESPLIARGLGRSYGDASLNTERNVLLTERMNCLLAFDETKGLLKAEAGASIEEILKVIVPRGWFLPVTPGTKFVTLGGCLATDVHGKNHHVDGVFSQYVCDIDLLLCDGSYCQCSPLLNAELFWATVGGMGLTGIIIRMTLQLIPITSAYMISKQYAAKNLDETIDILKDKQKDDRYSVAWVDCLATQQSLGRSIIMNAHHALPEELTKNKDQPFLIKPPQSINLPMNCFSWLLNNWTVKSFNSLYYSYQSKRKETFTIDYDRYFYPLDAVSHWNRIYGKNGFIQYQCVIPTQSTKKALNKILTELSHDQFTPFLAVLKDLGKKAQDFYRFLARAIRLPWIYPLKMRISSLFLII
jgi:FAD/FMN-containing dehydrogenase